MSGPDFRSFLGKKRGVNPPVYDPCSAGATDLTDLKTSKGISGVNSNSDNIARRDALGIKWL